MPTDTKARRCLLKLHVLVYINPSEACYQVLNQIFVLLGLVLLRLVEMSSNSEEHWFLGW